MGSTTSQTTSLSALKSTNVRLEYKGCILAATSVKFQCLDQSASAAFCGGTDGACYMYGKRSSAWSRVLVHACPITALHVSGATGQSTANILATGSDRGGCAVYDVNTCMEVSRATPHEDAAVTWVRSLPRKAACFLSAAKDGKACLWDSRLTPSTRVVRQYECGAQPIHSAHLLNEHALCTMRLVRVPGRGNSSRRSVSMSFWDLRAGDKKKEAAIDRVNFAWKDVDISLALLNLTSGETEPLPSGRYPLDMVTCGRRGSYTCMQCCDERGERIFSMEPTPRMISGACVGLGRIFIASPGPRVCHVPIMKKKKKRKMGTARVAKPVAPAISGQDPRRNRQRATVIRGLVQHVEIHEFHRKLTRLGASGNDIEMLGLLEDMEKVHGAYPSLMTFELVLRALLRSGNYALLQRCLELMRAARTKPTDSTAVALLRFASGHRPREKVVLLRAMHCSLERLGAFLSQVVREEFVLLLATHPNAESLDLAFKGIRDMIIQRMRVSQHLLKIFFAAVASRRATGLAYEIFHLMQLKMASDSDNSMKLSEFESVAITLSLSRNVGKVWEVLSSAMEKYGIRKTFDMACSLVRSFGRAGLIGESEKIVELMRQSEPEKRSWTWEHRALLDSAFVHAALSCAQLDLATTTFLHMPSRARGKGTAKATPGSASIMEAATHLVNMLEADGQRIDSMLSVVEHMQDLALDVPHECLVSVLGSLALHKRISEAMYLFNTLRHFRDIKPKDLGHDTARGLKAEAHHDAKCRALAVLVSTVGRAGLKKILNQLLSDIQGDPLLKGHMRIIENSVEALRCTGQARKAMFMWEDLAEERIRLPHTRLAFNNLIICHGVVCDHMWCGDAVAEMKRRGLPPDADTFAACMVACLSAGRPGNAAEWYVAYVKWQRARILRAVRNISKWFYTVVLRGHRRGAVVLSTRQQHQQQQPQPQPPVNIFKGVRQLIAKQHRLRQSSRSHPNMTEAFCSMIKRLVRHQSIGAARHCLSAYYGLCGTLCPTTSEAFLRALMHYEEEEEGGGGGQSDIGSNDGDQIRAKGTRRQKRAVASMQWCLQCLGPGRIAALSPTLFGRALEHILRYRERGHVSPLLLRTSVLAATFVRQYAQGGGLLCPSILEAMLCASWLDASDGDDVVVAVVGDDNGGGKSNDNDQEKGVGSLGMGIASTALSRHGERSSSSRVQLEDPRVIWRRAYQSGVRPSNRARLLLLKAIAIRENRADLEGGVREAVAQLRVFCDHGIRVHHLSWLISIALRYAYFEEAIWVARVEVRRNCSVPMSELVAAIQTSDVIGSHERRLGLLSRVRALHPRTLQGGKKKDIEDEGVVE